MTATLTSTSGRGLKALDLATTGLRLLLIIVTGVAVPLLILAATGRGTVTVNGVLDAPYTLQFDDGRSVGIEADSFVTRGFERQTVQALTTSPSIEAPLSVSRDDLNSRAVVIAMFSVWLGAAWVGIVNLRRIVRSSTAGSPFDAMNPSRLRRIGISVISVPVAAVVGHMILSRTLDTDVPFSVSVDRSNWMTLLIVGIGLFAVAEIFDEAVRLREFEESTI
jgi:hypothetical protein